MPARRFGSVVSDGKMVTVGFRGDKTSHSALLICDCGARFLDTTLDRAQRALASHQARAGCGHTAAQAVQARARRAHRGRP